ncbi:unnamed protein product [Hymenolepis diminuta]|uniref:Uncharacterized protein n=1 Tax=Hymenolepis diminuta TaxID=6216 RepID=A0A0R3SZ48_HYMDI|nr:unnamed protein product [Hymenolepis diminuta]
MGYDYEIKYQRTEDFGQADGLSRLLENQRAENEEAMAASVSVERNVQHILVESIRNTPVSAVEIQKETEKDTVLQKSLRFVKSKWPSSPPKGDLLGLYSRRMRSYDNFIQAILV